MIEQLKVEGFLKLAVTCPVFDVRSPGEFAHAHFPGAYSLPLFSDEERKVVGTAYKQQSREYAIKIGLDYYGVKMRGMVEEVEGIVADWKKQNRSSIQDGKVTILVHCWRGGMRSAGVAWLLDLYGFRVCTLKGGYKSFRTWVLAQFELPYRFNILGGYTGSGKTEILEQLGKAGKVSVDLEDLAQHKGSAFGGLGKVQPGQEMFENLLALALHKAASGLNDGEGIWLEDESQRIGPVNLPGALWKTMQASPVFFLDIPFEQRLDFIVAGYGKHKKEELVNAIIRIQKRLGSNDTKQAVNFLLEDNHRECFGVLLRYYDKFYTRSLENKPGNEKYLHRLPVPKVDAAENCKLLLDWHATIQL